MRNLFARLALFAIFVFALANGAQAQNNSSMTGVVTDSTGASIKGVTVTLKNPSKGFTATAVTESNGSYRFANVPPATGYIATFTTAGFATTTVNNITLLVGLPRTQDATLAAGSADAVSVSASSAEVTLNTTDASIGNNINPEKLTELPVQDRGSVQILFQLQPGVSPLGAVTGARQDQNETTLDGMDVNDIASGQTTGTFAITGGAPVDAIQEFRGTVAGLPTSIGTGGGGQFQLVTKSGSNRFHGLLYEYHRDNSTVANSWFNNNTTPIVPKAKYIRNQFGGNIGGPIWRDKAFFFFDMNVSRIIQNSTATRTVPLDSFRNGTINYVNNSSSSCSASSRLSTQPSCISSYTPAQIAALDPTLAGNNAAIFAYIRNRYPAANDLTLGDGYNTGGYRFTQNIPTNETDYVGRIDYNLTSNQHIFLRYNTIRRDTVQSLNQFGTDDFTYPQQNRSYGYSASHIWTISASKVNQFYYGSTVSVLNFPVNYFPTGNTSFTFTPLSAPNGSLNAQRRRVPIPEIRDDFNWQVGKHNIQIGGTFKFVKTNSLNRNDYEFAGVGTGTGLSALDASYRPSNILATDSTVVSRWDGAFTFALGHVASLSRNYNYDASGAALPIGTGAIRRYRYYQTEVYAGDTWKVTPSLTLNYGLRWQYYSVPYEVNGVQSNPSVSFQDYLAARVTQSNAGQSGNAAVPFISYSLGGKANAGGSDMFAPSWKDFAPRFGFSYNPEWARKSVINGSFGLVLDRTVVNALNFVQDQLSYLFQNSQSKAYGTGYTATPTCNASCQALTNDPRIGANLSYPAVPGPVAIDRSKPYVPYVSSTGVPTGITNGNTNYAIDKNLKTPYSMMFNLGWQQQIKGGFVLNTSYVGRLGRRLIGQADGSQLIEFRDPASGQSMSAAFAALSRQIRNNPASCCTAAAVNANITPQPWFENLMSSNLGLANKTAALAYYRGASLVKIGDFADTIQFLAANSLIPKNVGLASQFAANTFINNGGFSSYHAAIVTLTKNPSHGLQFQVNYTLSHSHDNTSAVANTIGLSSGTGQVCDALNRYSCYGNSDFDVRHIVNANFVYQLPVGRGRALLGSTNRFVDAAIGGWSVSGIPQWRSGQAWNTSTGAYLAGYANNVPGLFNGDKSAVKVRIHKDAANRLIFFDDPARAASAFANPAGFQYGSRNVLYGPSVFLFDAGVAKRFQVIENRVSLQLRGDAFNVLNHPVFSTPSATNINTSATFGQITTNPTQYTPRVLQISGRIEF